MDQWIFQEGKCTKQVNNNVLFFYYFCSRTAAVASMGVIFATSMGKEHCLEPWGTLMSGKTIAKLRPIAGFIFSRKPAPDPWRGYGFCYM
jgi:hypothetical protein